MKGAADLHPDRAVALAVASTHPRVVAALERLRDGGLVVVEGSWNSSTLGLLVQAAQYASQSSIAFMARHAGGLVCVPMPAERTDALGLLRARQHRDNEGVPYTTTVEARDGVSTGISAADRARTVRVLGDTATQAHDLVQPGHVVPIRVADETLGWPMATLELARLADLPPAVAVCHILDEQGAVADQPFVRRFSAEHDLPLLTGADIADRVRRSRRMLLAETAPPVRHGRASFAVTSYREGARRHYALVLGDPATSPPLVRVHVQQPVDDALGDARTALVESLDAIVEAGCGVLIYLAEAGEAHGAAQLWSLPYAAREILTELGIRMLYQRPPGPASRL